LEYLNGNGHFVCVELSCLEIQQRCKILLVEVVYQKKMCTVPRIVVFHKIVLHWCYRRRLVHPLLGEVSPTNVRNLFSHKIGPSFPYFLLHAQKKVGPLGSKKAVGSYDSCSRRSFVQAAVLLFFQTKRFYLIRIRPKTNKNIKLQVPNIEQLRTNFKLQPFKFRSGDRLLWVGTSHPIGRLRASGKDVFFIPSLPVFQLLLWHRFHLLPVQNIFH